MAGREYYRIGCIRRSGEIGWITSFDESGAFSISQNRKAVALFDSYDKVHHAKAFLDACNPLDCFDISRHISVSCRAASRPEVSQRFIDG